jgi:hypothetical protein
MAAPALRWGVMGTGWIAEKFGGCTARSGRYSRTRGTLTLPGLFCRPGEVLLTPAVAARR